jgi:hypothetical protein
MRGIILAIVGYVTLATVLTYYNDTATEKEQAMLQIKIDFYKLIVP